MGLFKSIQKKRRLKAIFKNNDITLSKKDMSRISLDIQGKNNIVKIAPLRNRKGKLLIRIAGNSNVIDIQEDCGISGCVQIVLGQIHPNFGAISHAKCYIGKSCTFESCNIITFNSNAQIHIGNNCMVSYGVNIYHTDAHPILDVKSHEIINKVKTLSIGDHVWIGANATILKNTSIAHDCIICWGGTVSGCFSEPYCAIAGNPGRIVKKGITWDSNGSKGYVQNEVKNEA